MQTSAIRVEVIRFSLLVTLTVALLSVAIRLASHNDAHSSLRPSRSPSGSSAPSASGAPSSSSPSFTASPAPLPSSTASFAPRGSGSGGSGGSGSGGSGGSGSGSGGAAGQPVLPVTGDDALKLIAMSLVFIGGGALTVRASRR